MHRLTSRLRRRLATAIGAICTIGFVGCTSPSVHTSPTTQVTGPSAQVVATRIASFSGEYRFLSNFWPAEVTFEGIRYPSVEHAYQAAKTLDATERKRIAILATPSEAKRAGRALAHRSDWEQVKLDVMERCVREKFMNHAELGAKLLATGEVYLEEGNDWGDQFWGVSKGKGENQLGKILMRIRAELRRPRAD